ncbi:MAG: hypothetical protein RIC55_15200 [Pirellulaceae bacterium]
MPNVYVIVTRPFNGQVVDVADGGTTGEVYVECSAERMDNNEPPDYVMAKVYEMSGSIPNTPPVSATELENGGGMEFIGTLQDCPSGNAHPLPQFRVAFWAGIYDEQAESTTWDAPIVKTPYGHTHEDLMSF